MKKTFILMVIAGIMASCGNNAGKKEDKEPRRVITLDNTPAKRPYSPAIEADNMLFVSGQIAVDQSTGKLVEGGIEAQTRQALTNLKNIIEKAGYKMSDIVRCTVLMQDISFYTPMNQVYMEFFPKDPPSRMAFAVKDLPMGALIEIDATAIR